jgi:hypothetical protein
MAIATARIDVFVEEASVVKLERFLEPRWAPGALCPQVQQISLAIGANTLTVPSGAAAVLIDPGSCVSLTLKGVTGDTGVPIAPASNPQGIPLLIPLGSVATFVIASLSVQTIEVVWL